MNNKSQKLCLMMGGLSLSCNPLVILHYKTDLIIEETPQWSGNISCVGQFYNGSNANIFAIPIYWETFTKTAKNFVEKYPIFELSYASTIKQDNQIIWQQNGDKERHNSWEILMNDAIYFSHSVDTATLFLKNYGDLLFAYPEHCFKIIIFRWFRSNDEHVYTYEHFITYLNFLTQ